MSDLHFEQLHWLWLAVAALPLLALFSVASAAVGSRRRRTILGIVRVTAILLCALALARPVAGRRAQIERLPRLFLLRDQSASVGDDQAAATQLRQALLGKLGNRVTFEELNFAGVTWKPGTAPAEQDATDIEAAIDQANGESLDSPKVHIVVMTDARSTRGTPAAAAARVAMRGGVVSVMPIGRARPQPPRIRQVEPPVVPQKGTRTAMRVTVAADQRVRARVILKYPDGTIADRRDLPIDSQATLLLHFDAREQGVQNYSLELQTWADSAASPGAPPAEAALPATRTVPVYVQGPPRILICDNFIEGLGGLKHALEPLQLPIDTVTPGDWPDDLTPYSAVVLSDLSGSEFSDAQRTALTKFVRDDGGGLVFVGGGNVIASRWGKNSLSEALPVVIQERPPKVVKKPPAVSICFIIDESGSMKEGLPASRTDSRESASKLDLVKAAIAKCVGTLPDGSHVAVVAFNALAFRIVSPMAITQDADRTKIVAQVNSIDYGGGTHMETGLEMGLTYLAQPTMPGDKFLVVLTDGESEEDKIKVDWKKFADEARRGKYHWTSIGVGKDITARAEEILKRELAANAGTDGVYCFCRYATEIPEVFDAQASTMLRIAEPKPKPFHAKPGPDAAEYPAKGPAIDDFPELFGMVPSQPRTGSKVMVVGEKDAPLLASGEYGLGKVVAFTSDTKNDWGSLWVQWPQLSQFWVEATRAVRRPPQTISAHVRAHTADGEARFVFQVRDAKDRPMNGLSGSASLVDSGGTAAGQSPEVHWKQTGPGEYVAGVPVPGGATTSTFVLTLERPGAPPLHYCASISGHAGAETAATGPDPDAAASIAQAGNGMVSDDPAQIASLSLNSRTVTLLLRKELWSWFVMAAIAMWPIDVAARKMLT
jgi:uncharacterized membrane protein